MKAPVLQSERLILEPLSLKHLSKEYLNWLNDPEVINYLELKEGYTTEQLKNYIIDVQKGIFFLGNNCQKNHKHIGNIKIDPINLKHGLCEYGIMVGDKSEWGKGFAREASLIVIDYCFNTLHLRKMTLGVVEDNVNAVSLYKKIGFNIEGLYKDHRFHNNQYWNTLRMALFNPQLFAPNMKLVLGTVQFGIPYGINNSAGVPDNTELSAILELAFSSGIRILDTAGAYGNSEERIATLSQKEFNIVTKFSEVHNRLDFTTKLNISLKRLNTNCVYGYISHNANNLIQFPGIWEDLIRARDEFRTVRKIGYSLYTIEQLEELLNIGFIPDMVQLPYSLLDRKFDKYLPELKKMGVEIHIRSVFLQGLYFMNPDNLPTKLKPLKNTLKHLHNLCDEYNTSIGSLALNFVHNNKNIDFVVIGVDTNTQLRNNIDIVKSDINLQLISLVNEISVSNLELLNPGNWSN